MLAVCQVSWLDGAFGDGDDGVENAEGVDFSRLTGGS